MQRQGANYHIIWSPVDATTFLISNDNNENSTMSMWDLRTPEYPVLNLTGKSE